MALSDNIRERRLSLGMTQEQLANHINTTKMAVSKYESNLAKPQPEMFVLIARALGTTCEELVNGKENDYGRAETYHSDD